VDPLQYNLSVLLFTFYSVQLLLIEPFVIHLFFKITLAASVVKYQCKPWFKQLVRRFNANANNNQVPKPSLGNISEKTDPLAEYYHKTKLGIYNVNYLKVGHGPHAVFCYPGILGAMRTHLKELVAHMKQRTDEYTFYAWDQPGYGQSRPPKRIFTDVSLQEDSDLSLDLMKELGHKKYSVMGWSGGGLSALLFATQNQDIIRKLIVWGVFAYVDKEDYEKFEWFRDIENWGGLMKEVLVEEYGNDFFVESWQTWMDILKRMYSHNQGEFCAQALHKITCPTFILHGVKDNFVREKHARFLQKNIANSKLLIMPHGKHNLQIRYHQEFFDAVHNFLQDPEVSP